MSEIRKSVPLDVANRVMELRQEGYGRDRIALWTGLSSGMVKNIIEGKRQSFDDTLSTRQIQQFITCMPVVQHQNTGDSR